MCFLSSTFPSSYPLKPCTYKNDVTSCYNSMNSRSVYLCFLSEVTLQEAKIQIFAHTLDQY